MKRQSYRINHDFLFDSKDEIVSIPHLEEVSKDVSYLRITDVFRTRSEATLLKRLKPKATKCIIVDDIGECNNPSSERYKQFIIRCLYRKLKNNNIELYI